MIHLPPLHADLNILVKKVYRRCSAISLLPLLPSHSKLSYSINEIHKSELYNLTVILVNYFIALIKLYVTDVERPNKGVNLIVFQKNKIAKLKGNRFRQNHIKRKV